MSEHHAIHIDFAELENKAKHEILDAAKLAINGPAKEAIVVDAVIKFAIHALKFDDGTPGDEIGKVVVTALVRSIVRATYRKLRNAGEIA